MNKLKLLLNNQKFDHLTPVEVEKVWESIKYFEDNPLFLINNPPVGVKKVYGELLAPPPPVGALAELGGGGGASYPYRRWEKRNSSPAAPP